MDGSRLDGAVAVCDADLDDRDAAALWATSGAGWLTDPAVGVPVGLVRRVVGLVERLDAAGAGLAEVVGASGVGALAERAGSMGLRPAGTTSAGGASRLVRAADGWLAVSLARRDDRELLPAWTDGVLSVHADEAQIVSVIAGRGVTGLVERAALLGLPCSEVGEVTDRRPVIAHRCGEAAPTAPARAIVVDLASLWAGPLAADVLARLGARLITVESVRRPDGGRLARRFFRALHGRSESVALDPTTIDGRRRLAELIAHADVVIEGSRPRALAQLGVDAAGSVAAGGPQVWISITAHGRSGAAGDRVGFGDDAAAAGGLVGDVDGEPRFVADAVADPLTGLTAAAAALELLGRGGRWLADVALARTARSVVGPFADVIDRSPERPRPRVDAGGPMPLGRDTESVLAGFGID